MGVRVRVVAIGVSPLESFSELVSIELTIPVLTVIAMVCIAPVIMTVK